MVLEFDHLGGKEYNVSEPVGQAYSLGTIRREIEKCEVVCANCPRRRTFTRGKTFKWRLSIEWAARGSNSEHAG